ncbi:MAG: glycosyltransferase family 4 protein [Verrucomicrobiota bacterium]
MPKIPVVQTNVFGRFDNPRENAWTDFRLFISWTSCVQAARRSFMLLDNDFFRHSSVAVYPVVPSDGPASSEVQDFRQEHGIRAHEVLFGRLARPEPNKWTNMPVEAFRIGLRQNPDMKLLLREPPPEVKRALEQGADRDQFIILPATSDSAELALTIASLDAVLHGSSIGESFGYGIAEAMNYGKPVIANSTPWQDQAQIELVRDGECGFIASTPQTTARAILKLANDVGLRAKLGRNAQFHIRQLADPVASTDRMEGALEAAVGGYENPNTLEDLAMATTAENYLDQEQLGHSWRDKLALSPYYYRVRFHEWRRAFRSCGLKKSARL